MPQHNCWRFLLRACESQNTASPVLYMYFIEWRYRSLSVPRGSIISVFLDTKRGGGIPLYFFCPNQRHLLVNPSRFCQFKTSYNRYAQASPTTCKQRCTAEMLGHTRRPNKPNPTERRDSERQHKGSDTGGTTRRHRPPVSASPHTAAINATAPSPSRAA